MPQIRGLAAILLIALASACDKFAAPPAVVRLTVTNGLVAPITLSVDDAPILGLQAFASAPIAVPSSATWLTWASAKPLDARGRLIPDDVADVRIALASLDRVLEINNVIGGNIYVTARFINRTAVPVAIAVYDGARVSCASRLPAGSAGSTGFTQIGYYRLLPTTEIRAYRDPERCEGAYAAWSPSQIRAFAPGSGLLTLTLDAAP